MSEPVELHRLSSHGDFPASALPVLVYRHVVPGARGEELARELERKFHAHDWTASWRDGVYDYAHYHSTAHEVLGCYAGHAHVELGAGALVVELHAGDVLVLPAGTAHRNVGASDDFAVVGAYAGGRDYDMQRGPADPDIEAALASVPLPRFDPVHGSSGPLLDAWRAPTLQVPN